ncbi:ABC transporter permease [Clostridium tetanomorphum]|uniref:ABC transporter permease n=1 Tax=Clostridium tetanomorphum TaxID=1553 RepID=A0A923EDR9_CLOTT|nr:ABC transporter permease [Clostridium tetanomorphum]MBC2398808.1 ABC transporter permease [Clostridium tetanomorphum]NRZ96826.1 hypothetical protein [Clostridium tetanomorphum]
MIKLIQLELKRNKLRTYIISTGVIALSLIVFIYMFLFISTKTQVSGDVYIKNVLSNYETIILLVNIISCVCFATLSGVMYSRFVINEYSGKRAILLFSYPVSPKKIMFTKLLIVSLFTFLAYILSSILVYTIFFMGERFIHIIPDTLTISKLIIIVKTTVIMSLFSLGIGIIAMRIGFSKKSVPVTIVSAFTLSVIPSNIISNAIGITWFPFVFMIISVIVGMAVFVNLVNIVNKIEVE